MFATIMMTLRW